MINLIYSISHEGNILGDRDKNDLVFNIKEDLAFFKKMTSGKKIIMGKNTFISLPKGGLPKRKHILLSNTIRDQETAKLILGDRYIEELEFLSGTQLVNFIKENGEKNIQEEFFIIGGAQVYDLFINNEEFRNEISNIYVTEVMRTPDIANPVYLKSYEKVKEFFKREVITKGKGKDRFNDNREVDFTVYRYFC